MYLYYSIIGMGALAVGLCLRRSVQVENGNHLIFSPFLVFCICELTMTWPAAVFARIEGISTDSHATMVVVSSTLAFAFGYCATRSLSGWTRSPFRFWSLPLEASDSNSHALAIMTSAVLFLPVGLYAYQGLPPAVAGLQRSLSGGVETSVAEMVSARRLELTKGHYFGGEYRGQGAVRAIMRIGWPFLTAIAMIMLLRRRRQFWFCTSVGLLAACFVFIAGDGTRGPFLWSVVGLLVTASYQAKLRLRTCLASIVMLAAALLALSLPQKLAGAAQRGALWEHGSRQLVERVFVGNGIHTIHAIELVRSGDITLRWGTIHANDMAAALPFVPSGTPFVYELFLLQNPNARATQTTFANTTYLGVVYAEFGWLGCIIGYGALGGVIALISQTLFGARKTATNVASVGMVAMYAGQISLCGSVYGAVSVAVLLVVALLYRSLLVLYCHSARTARPQAVVSHPWRQVRLSRP